MACVENIPPGNGDSEMEEGEIVDEIDDLSDISSEEEFLLRERLQVLEKYNYVLERKKAKGSSAWSGKQRQDALLHDLSELSGTDLDTFPNVTSKGNVVFYKNNKDQRHLKPHHKPKKERDVEPHNLNKNRERRKKSHRKKRLEVKVISESSEESDDHYRNKRRKLANAVKVHRNSNDTSSLQARLQKMINGTKYPEPIYALDNEKQTEPDIQSKVDEIVPKLSDIPIPNYENEEPHDKSRPDEVMVIEDTKRIYELIDLCTQDDADVVCHEQTRDTKDLVIQQSQDTVDTVTEKRRDTIDSVTQEFKDDEETKKVKGGDSDEDLEQLRQHALKTKASKPKPEQSSNVAPEPQIKPIILSEDEDSDTAELRLICLKSALLKKAMEMKRKQKLQKRLSQSSNLQDDLFEEKEDFLNRIDAETNHMSVDMDIGSDDMDIASDCDEKEKDIPNESAENNNAEQETKERNTPKVKTPKEDEFEEDEDLLRARLLTSLSKNLPNLVDPTIIESIDKPQATKDCPITNNKTQMNNVPEEKRIIINLGESDSEGEHEATKNLTKMHMKLSEQVDFQQKLDIFLKSTRMEVEQKKLPDVVQKPLIPKMPQKFVAKVVNNLPKSEQIEYKNLVKRMTELEKIKQVRQSTMDLANKTSHIKDTLKPRNVTSDSTKFMAINNLDEQIALSRKKIAEESVRMLKLREEATKLIQKQKIVQTELRNITTAITLNRREQRMAQNRLCKIRLQHQRLLKSSTSKHSSVNGHTTSINRTNPLALTSKLQKENNPTSEEHRNTQKSMKISIVNDFKEETVATNKRLSVQVDIGSNKKTVNLTETVRSDCVQNNNIVWKESDASLPVVEKGGGNRKCSKEAINSESIDRSKEFNDYKSPLQALGTATWDGDPNAILCPFVVGGDCMDPDCHYLHPKAPSQ